LLDNRERGIPHFVRNDAEAAFFRGLFNRAENCNTKSALAAEVLLRRFEPRSFEFGAGWDFFCEGGQDWLAFRAY